MIQATAFQSTSASSFEVCFNQRMLASFPEATNQVALLVTSEYEGIFRNGGIGTYYRTLSEKLSAAGWYVVLLLCQTQERFGGKSHIPALKHIFSSSECQEVLDLQPMHRAILSQFKDWEWVDRENYCALFFAQAIAAQFNQSSIYIEFPETLGLGYRTIQAKRAGVLGKNCLTAVTIHSGQEWIHEAHGKYTLPLPHWCLQTCHYEQSSFEQTDLAFFPSHFLKEKVTSYGWKTDHALHLPHFIPEVEQFLAPEPLRDDLKQELNTGKIPIVFFGRLEERKGLISFVEAIRLLDADIAERLQILFMGRTVQLQVETLQHLNSEEYIQQALGHCTYRIISDLYSREAIEFIRQLDHPIVCLTSHQENFPNTALEMGQLPVSLVVSDTGGFRETLNLIERSDAVHWFTPGDECALLQSLKQVIAAYPEQPAAFSNRILHHTNWRLLDQRLQYIKQIDPASTNSESLVVESDEMSMLSLYERSYLRNYAENNYSGSGEIVDIGCWLGSSTIPLAIGLQQNSAIAIKENRIHAYDIFIWQSSYMERSLIGTPLRGKYTDGDSFVEAFRERIAPWNPLIRVYPGDLEQIGWNQDPIEFLFIDAMKSWNLANSILKNFFPSLIPGLSLVVHQDFAHFYGVWIHLIMYRLREYLVPIEHPFLYSSRVFQYVKPIPNELLQMTYSLASFPEAEVEAALTYSRDITPKQMHPNIEAVRVMYWIQVGDAERAKVELTQARAKFDRAEWLELALVEDWLERGDWFIPYR